MKDFSKIAKKHKKGEILVDTSSFDPRLLAFSQQAGTSRPSGSGSVSDETDITHPSNSDYADIIGELMSFVS